MHRNTIPPFIELRLSQLSVNASYCWVLWGKSTFPPAKRRQGFVCQVFLPGDDWISLARWLLAQTPLLKLMLYFLLNPSPPCCYCCSLLLSVFCHLIVEFFAGDLLARPVRVFFHIEMRHCFSLSCLWTINDCFLCVLFFLDASASSVPTCCAVRRLLFMSACKATWLALKRMEGGPRLAPV